ncbi:type II toxin-antitoxin system RelE/ParE family toxin [uncultured Sphingomonas sp.]|uniref:type II toxin-antitoxin system RelE/ParE family toxin n=1 Tax=uncultured Sphingomonas sp. TaxID=158754 RepID=UPI0035CC9749
MRLELSRRAQADLDDIRDYSAERFGAKRAIAYLDAVEWAFRRIVDFPEIGPAYGASDGIVRSYPAEEHRIYYEHDAGRVFVLRVLHKRMDAVRHL